MNPETDISALAQEGEVPTTTEALEVAPNIGKDEAFSQLMDQVEASFPEQGRWAIKLGEKSPVTRFIPGEKKGFIKVRRTPDTEEVVGYRDTRAFILKDVVTTEAGVVALVITADGVKVLNMPYGQDGKPCQEAKLIELLADPNSGWKLNGTQSNNGYVKGQEGATLNLNGDDGNDKISSAIRMGMRQHYLQRQRVRTEDFGGTQEEFMDRVSKSIARAENPVAGQVRFAQSTATAIGSLPPRE